MAGGGGFRLLPALNPEKPILPDPERRNVLVTSALPYVNNVPHLGNIVGCVLSADVFARYSRQRGDNTIYLCGTDEYGTATETRAIKEGVTPREICDKYHALHKGVYEWFQIAFDHFGRTSDPKQTEVVQGIFKKVKANGYVSEDAVTQLYCAKCDHFLADRFVEGTCPNCKFESARGDQCDNCAKLLHATELVAPRCTVCSSTPEQRTSNHLFLDLEKLTPNLEKWLESTMTEERWTKNARSITKTWVQEGLRPRCITRDLKWGVPVPEEKFDNKVFYVWFDAPMGYISITASYTDQWKRWWQTPQNNVELHQFMGKDNVAFHTVLFPSALLGTHDPWLMLSRISTTDYLTYEGTQFSKSRNVGVFGSHVMELPLSPDCWRYYLMMTRPESSDSNFMWDDLYRKTNDELLANIGNFLNRTLKFVWSKYEGKVPQAHLDKIGEAEKTLITEANLRIAEYREKMDAQRLREGLNAASAISHAGNVYLQTVKSWELWKSDREHCDTAVALSINVGYLLATLLAPFTPGLASNTLYYLNVVSEEQRNTFHCHPYLPEKFEFPSSLFQDHTIRSPDILVQKFDTAVLESLLSRFSVLDTASEGHPRPPAAGSSKKGKEPSKGGAPEAKKAKKEKNKAPENLSPEALKVKGELDVLSAQLRDLMRNKAGAEEITKTKLALKEKGQEYRALTNTGKKEKKQKLKEESASVNPLEMRVGRIVEGRIHPQAHSLYIFKVDVGEEEPRQICAGLRKAYNMDDLVNKQVVVLCNLKPAKLVGEVSQGMIMAAGEGETVGVTTPAAEVPCGTLVAAEGYAHPEQFKKVSKSVLGKVALRTAEGRVTFEGVSASAAGVPIKIDISRPQADGTHVR